MPEQFGKTTTPQRQTKDVDVDAADVSKKKSERRKDADPRGNVVRRKDDGEVGKRQARQPRRRSTGNQPSPVPSEWRESKTPRPFRSSRQGSSRRMQSDVISPQRVRREGASSSARALAPSCRDSPRSARPRCTKTAEASVVASPVIKMRERRSSLPSAASVRSPFKRSRERRPSLSNSTWMNTTLKLDSEAPLLTISEKDDLNKLLTPRRMRRRRTLATSRVETDSSSEEQPIVFAARPSAKKKVAEEEPRERIKTDRRASAVGSSKSAKKVVESPVTNRRSKSATHTSSQSVSPRQRRPSRRRSRSASMQHVPLQSEAVRNVSNGGHRLASASVADTVSKESRSAARTSHSKSPRKSKSSLKEKKLESLGTASDNDDDASINILDNAPDEVDNGEGFFAVRSFIYEQ
ncbi:hypothetical protein FisN_23Lh133 [Fistulifera solaris]|uniref:Uncharacterized protein n=1 Tax=Fistulifera solaris TaxID=1519565 RepID=A0A1Z5KMX9_FISSO|nr:hypothetical protein FisN_23Lh133 [Fistulifera solaris]|eukprot:GAX27298.1 hypothetical protein FisN_23Lh133 [Fistulifera solaris]